MNEMIRKLRDLEREVSGEKGDFALFALFLREDSPNVWDLVVSAPWIDAAKPRALRDLAKRIRKSLTAEELTNLSRIVLIDTYDPALHALQKTFTVQHGLAEIRDSVFFGLPIRQGYVITSLRAKAA